MRVIVIGTDKTIMDMGSVVQTRQVEYFKDFERTDIFVLGKGASSHFQIGNIYFKKFGGNRFTSFVQTFFNIHLKLKSKTGNEKYDLIYTQDVLYCGLMGMLLKKITGVKLVTQIHGDYLDNPLWINQRFENKILNVLGKKIIKNSDYIRCVSNRIVKYCVETLGKDSSRVKSLPIGIDGNIFNSNNVLENRKKQIVFVGRLMGEKEPHFFCDIVIPILQKHTDYTAVMVGNGPLEQELKKRFADVGLENQVEFPGFLQFENIAKYYKEGFVFLHTAFWEGWGLPMVESTACGMPNVTTDTGCAGEVVLHNHNGIIVQGKNKYDYIEAIENLIQNPDVYKNLVNNCLQSGTEWTFPVMCQKTKDFLEYAKNN